MSTNENTHSHAATRATFKSYLGAITVEKRPPMPHSHPLIGRGCFFCGKPVMEGDETCLVPTRPATEDDWYRMYNGDAYRLHSELAHWTCVEEFARKGG